MPEKKQISIVGFGRFGQLLASILQPDFLVKVYDKDQRLQEKANDASIEFASLKEVLQAQTIFYCVPISLLKEIIREHLPLYGNTQKSKLIVDVSSVKTYPKQVLTDLLPANYQLLLTHPMFGPDSVKAHGLDGQTIVIDNSRLSEEYFSFWRQYFASKNLKVVAMSAEEHDLLVAKSQAVTHIIGRMLDEVGFEPTSIDTVGVKRLYGIKEQTCNDTWQLFVDLQTFNPFAAQMRAQLGQAFTSISKRLDHISKEHVYF